MLLSLVGVLLSVRPPPSQSPSLPDQLTPVKVAGNVSETTTPVAAEGPLLLSMIVYVATVPAGYEVWVKEIGRASCRERMEVARLPALAIYDGFGAKAPYGRR